MSTDDATTVTRNVISSSTAIASFVPSSSNLSPADLLSLNKKAKDHARQVAFFEEEKLAFKQKKEEQEKALNSERVELDQRRGIIERATNSLHAQKVEHEEEKKAFQKWRQQIESERLELESQTRKAIAEQQKQFDTDRSWLLGFKHQLEIDRIALGESQSSNESAIKDLESKYESLKMQEIALEKRENTLIEQQNEAKLKDIALKAQETNVKNREFILLQQIDAMEKQEREILSREERLWGEERVHQNQVETAREAAANKEKLLANYKRALAAESSYLEEKKGAFDKKHSHLLKVSTPKNAKVWRMKRKVSMKTTMRQRTTLMTRRTTADPTTGREKMALDE